MSKGPNKESIEKVQPISQDIFQEGENDDNIVTKMAQIRTRADNWIIFIGVLLLGLALSIIGTATYFLSTRITSELGSFDVSAITDVIQTLLTIFFIPFYAALSDVYGRGLILTISLAIMVAGMLMISFAQSFAVYSAGNIINSIGETGRAFLIPIILADFLKPRNRGYGFIIFWLPSLLALGLSIPIVEPIKEFGWRYIYIIQAILVAITGLPILFGLFRLQKRAQRLTPKFNFKASSLLEVDWVGIILFTSGLGCILCPFTLVIRYEEGWAAPAMFVPLIFGVVVLGLFAIWEWKYTRYPLVSKHMLSRRAMIIMIIIRAFQTLDGAMTWQYLNSYLLVSRGISEDHLTLITLSFRLTWYIMGFVTAVALQRIRSVRWIVWTGVALNVIGVGLTLPARHPHSSEAFIILAEALIGTGSGISTCAGMVVLQSTVDFKDIAKASALDNLVSSVLSAIGSAVATATWNSNLTKNLIAHLPEEYSDQVPGLIADIFSLLELPAEVTEDWQQAFGDTQWLMCTIATVLACVCFVIALFLPEVDLDKCQVIDEVKVDDINGEKQP